MSESVNQCMPDQLWVPGLHLDTEFPTPSEEELALAWTHYTGRHTINPTEVFGAISEPTQPITAVASVDLCEVVRRTSAAFDTVIGEDPHDRSTYAKYDWLHSHDRGPGYAQSVVVSVVRTLMNNGLIAPKEDLVAVRRTLQAWRASGVYVLANTSTLPGCELGTISDFATTYGLKGCFDGLILPRNHDGTGSITKAGALKSTVKDLGVDIYSLPVLHIDDSLHHIDGFTQEYESHDALGLFIPIHADNAHMPTDNHYLTTYEALQQATRFLRQSGVKL